MELPGEKVSIRILDLFDKWVSAGLRPRQIKRNANARREAQRLDLLDAAQTQNDVDDIRARRKAVTSDGKLIALPPPNVHPLKLEHTHREELSWWASLALSDELAERLRKLSNLKKIAVYAEEEAERITDEGMKEDATVESAWFAHWRRLAEQVSQEDAQRLWARVLAGEAKSPGLYGHRTLEFLAVMTKRDALLIERAAQFRIDENVLFSDFNELYEHSDLSVEARLHLENIGVLANAASGFGGPQRQIKAQAHADRYLIVFGNNGRGLMLLSKEPRTLSFSCAVFTEMGVELMSFVNAETNYPLLTLLAKKAMKEGFQEPMVGDHKGNVLTNIRPFVIDEAQQS